MNRRVISRFFAGAACAALLVPAAAGAEDAEKTPPVEAAAPAGDEAAPDCLRRKDMFTQQEIDEYEAAKTAAANDPKEFDRVKRAWRTKQAQASEALGKPLCRDLKKSAPANPCGDS